MNPRTNRQNWWRSARFWTSSPPPDASRVSHCNSRRIGNCDSRSRLPATWISGNGWTWATYRWRTWLSSRRNTASLAPSKCAICRTIKKCSCAAPTTIGPRTGTRCARTCRTTRWPTSAARAAKATARARSPPVPLPPSAPPDRLRTWPPFTTRSRSAWRYQTRPVPWNSPCATSLRISSVGTTTTVSTTACRSPVDSRPRLRSNRRPVAACCRLPRRMRDLPISSTPRHLNRFTILAPSPDSTLGTHGAIRKTTLTLIGECRTLFAGQNVSNYNFTLFFFFVYVFIAPKSPLFWPFSPLSTVVGYKSCNISCENDKKKTDAVKT